MSNLSSSVEQECNLQEGCSAIKMVLTPKETDLGGFKVRRALPVKHCRSIGPWVFFDEMGPVNFAQGEGIDVRPHPHIGLATVTYLFDGEMLHRDSLGNTEIVKPGDLNLMIAGRGIAHSERQRDEIKLNPQSLHGLQLWLALPEHLEQMDPEFHHYDKSEIPNTEIDGVTIRVLIGDAYGICSPVKTLSKTIYIEASLKPGQRMKLIETEECALYVLSGKVIIKDTQLNSAQMAIFDDPKGVVFEATEDSTIAIIGGESVGERFVEWNFVASDKALISKAKDDWNSDRFEKVVGDEVEFIPLPN